ncbi:MAG: hypothetical protein K2N15_01675 [Lachnospiraceae bacterium]|nr:hypothetical protein [Lachnospiraceae bacterium]
MIRADLSSCLLENNYTIGIIEKKSIENVTEKKCSTVSEYYDYLKKEYKCLNDRNYTVNISPEYLAKCIKDPKIAETLEKNLAHLPIDHQNMNFFWNARGAELKNEEWNFDANGNVGGSPCMYVVSKDAGETSNNDKGKKVRKKPNPQGIYERKKQIREQFEARQERKKQLETQFEETQIQKEMDEEIAKKNMALRKQNVDRVLEKYND